MAVSLVLRENVGLMRWEWKFWRALLKKQKVCFVPFFPGALHFHNFVPVGLIKHRKVKMLSLPALEQTQVLTLFKFFTHLTLRI